MLPKIFPLKKKGYIQGKLAIEYGLIEPNQIVNVNGLLMANTLVDSNQN